MLLLGGADPTWRSCAGVVARSLASDAACAALLALFEAEAVWPPDAAQCRAALEPLDDALQEAVLTHLRQRGHEATAEAMAVKAATAGELAAEAPAAADESCAVSKQNGVVTEGSATSPAAESELWSPADGSVAAMPAASTGSPAAAKELRDSGSAPAAREGSPEATEEHQRSTDEGSVGVPLETPLDDEGDDLCMAPAGAAGVPVPAEVAIGVSHEGEEEATHTVADVAQSAGDLSPVQAPKVMESMADAEVVSNVTAGESGSVETTDVAQPASEPSTTSALESGAAELTREMVTGPSAMVVEKGPTATVVDESAGAEESGPPVALHGSDAEIAALPKLSAAESGAADGMLDTDIAATFGAAVLPGTVRGEQATTILPSVQLEGMHTAAMPSSVSATAAESAEGAEAGTPVPGGIGVDAGRPLNELDAGAGVGAQETLQQSDTHDAAEAVAALLLGTATATQEPCAGDGGACTMLLNLFGCDATAWPDAERYHVATELLGDALRQAVASRLATNGKGASATAGVKAPTFAEAPAMQGSRLTDAVGVEAQPVHGPTIVDGGAAEVLLSAVQGDEYAVTFQPFLAIREAPFTHSAVLGNLAFRTVATLGVWSEKGTWRRIVGLRHGDVRGIGGWVPVHHKVLGTLMSPVGAVSAAEAVAPQVAAAGTAAAAAAAAAISAAPTVDGWAVVPAERTWAAPEEASAPPCGMTMVQSPCMEAPTAAAAVATASALAAAAAAAAAAVAPVSAAAAAAVASAAAFTSCGDGAARGRVPTLGGGSGGDDDEAVDEEAPAAAPEVVDALLEVFLSGEASAQSHKVLATLDPAILPAAYQYWQMASMVGPAGTAECGC
eukprot:NODE_461_length_3024_cov_4.309976.p1 GENE.NODE_461_length_3024_cov_4.309976~~NODE_461_length_3024_cov_4.309976.p1  ORF type:complete len:917 (-),score=269.89 NODE_461_length_3024_cov_4.309976:273-2816(-)